MGRPYKIGVDNFSLDAGIFEDEMYLEILRSCGGTATAVLMWVMANIYREKGYYLEWNRDVCGCLAGMVGIDECLVEGIIEKAVEVGFFSAGQFRGNQILTSVDIQTRYFKATRRRKGIVWDERYLLIKDVLPENAKFKNVEIEVKAPEKKKSEARELQTPEKVVPDCDHKKWTSEKLMNEVLNENDDKLMSDDDVFAFLDFWTGQGSDGNYKFTSQDFWNTRFMMHKFMANMVFWSNFRR